MSAPIVSGINTSLVFNQVVTSSLLFSVTDPEGDPIQQYGFYDGGAGLGFFRVGSTPGVGEQSALTVLTVNAADLANFNYVGGALAGAETLWVSASDGTGWSNWVSLTARTQAAPNALPVVTAPARNSDQNTWRLLSELVTMSDADGDAIVQLEIRDLTPSAGSAYFYANGVIQPQAAVVVVSGADIANVYVNGGTELGAHSFEIRAFDTFGWSGVSTLTLTTRAQANRAPVVRVDNAAVQAGATLGLASVLEVTDADADPLFSFELYDAGTGGGFLRIGGVVQPALTIIPVSAAQLASTQYVGGGAAGVEQLWVRVNDGQAWSAWEDWWQFTQTRATNTLPLISAPARNSDQNTWRLLSELVTVSDADGDPINQYRITDTSGGATSAYLYANGAIQAQGASVTVNAADLAGVYVNGGTELGAHGFEIRAFDTFGWSGVSTLTLTTRAQANRAPVVTANDVVVVTGQPVPTGSLFSYSDADADPLFSFELYDAGTGGGFFRIGGVAQPALTVIPVSAAQLASLEYVGGAVRGTETFWVRASDGQAWSVWDDGTLRTVRATNALPVVSVPNQVLTPLQWTLPAVSSFVSVTDADADPILRWQIQDLTATAGSSLFYANGAYQPQGALVTTTDLGTTYIPGGMNPGTDQYQIRGMDSEGGWSAWTPFNVWTDRAPVVSARTGGVSVDASNHVVPASFFITPIDPDGDPILSYELYDAGAGGGFLRIGGVAQPALTVIPISAAELAQTEYVGGASDGFEALYVRASDGGLWSAWASWGMYTVAFPIRFPEVLGDQNANSFNATFNDTVFFGRGGADTFNTSVGSSAVFIGGPGADTYRFFADNSGTIVADGRSGSTGDVADLSSMGWAFGSAAAISGIIDGRHLFLGHVTPVIQTGAIFLDWRMPESRIETWQLWGGGSFTFDQMASALAGAPSMMWEQAGLPTAQINEAITYYGLREIALAAP